MTVHAFCRIYFINKIQKQYKCEYNGENQVHFQEIGQRKIILFRFFVAQKLVPDIRVGHNFLYFGNSIYHAGVKITFPECRTHVLSLDASGQRVGQHSFYAITGSDTVFFCVFHHQNQQAVVFIRLADAPFAEEVRGKAVNVVVRSHVVYHDHNRFGCGDRANVTEHGIEFGLGLRRNYTVRIGNQASGVL